MFGSPALGATTELTRKTTFYPLLMSHPDLLRIVSRVRTLAGDGDYIEELSVREGDSTISLNKGFDAEQLKSLPAEVHRLHYYFNPSGKSVSSISLVLGDGTRELEVRGASADAVSIDL